VSLSSEAEARSWFAAREDVDAASLSRLEKLEAMLREENDRQNLVSAASLNSLWLRHFVDSAQLLDHVPRGNGHGVWLDLGTGAGFPGLVIAVCRPGWPIELIESRAKRIAWLEHVVAELGLRTVKVVGVRLERHLTHPAGVISARAFAPLARLIALSARFSTPQTLWLLPKGRRGRQELVEMPKQIQTMFHVEQSITDPSSVILVGKGVPVPNRQASRA
jgi:16S rRNA (guanine527-N7)-methyltransferase